MKKIMLVLVLIALLFSVGCSTAWYEHDTIYKTNAHMGFSLFGYQNADQSDMDTQNAQGGWWGEPIQVKE